MGTATLLASSLTFFSLGCSGDSEGQLGDASGPSGGDASTGGASAGSGGATGNGNSTSSGGSRASGGSNAQGGSGFGGVGAQGGSAAGGAAAGGSSAGGTASGGSQGTGGRSLGANECSDEVACNVGSTCYAPGHAGPVVCGAIDWCGECQCPPQTPLPIGTSRACSQETPCPEPSDAEPVAHLCDAESGSCTECLTSDDCPATRPVCGTDAYSGARACFECESNADCPQERPGCALDQGAWGSSTAGHCVECLVDTQCAIGVCSSQLTCVPGCTTDEQCPPNMLCGERQRCEFQTCVAGGCSSASLCLQEGDTAICVPRTCTDSTQCGAGNFCVFGSCYDQPGYCEYDAVP